MNKIKQYFKLQEELHEYFGYKEDWVIFPMEDSTDVWWSIPDETHDHVYDIMPVGHPDAGKKVSMEYDKSVYFSNKRENHIKLIEYSWNWDKAGEDVGNDCYSNEIYNQRFLKSAIFEGKDFTMILVDTHTDGNKYLQIFVISNGRRDSSHSPWGGVWC